jgi:hypothetical protein
MEEGEEREEGGGGGGVKGKNGGCCTSQRWAREEEGEKGYHAKQGVGRVGGGERGEREAYMNIEEAANSACIW